MRLGLSFGHGMELRQTLSLSQKLEQRLEQKLSQQCALTMTLGQYLHQEGFIQGLIRFQIYRFICKAGLCGIRRQYAAS